MIYNASETVQGGVSQGRRAVAQLSLSLFGPFQVTLGAQPVSTFESARVRALLAYLAVEAQRPHPREALAELLWPGWPQGGALANLRRALSNLREGIRDGEAQPPYLLIARETLRFNTASDHLLDVSAFTELLSGSSDRPDREELERAVALCRGRFLEGFALGDCPAFEEWVLLQRETLDRLARQALHSLAGVHEQRGEYEPAERYARQGVQLEPLDEQAQRQLMRALALRGQRNAALAQYLACRRLLAQELGVEPAAETTALYESIRQGTLVGRSPLPPLSELGEGR